MALKITLITAILLKPPSAYDTMMDCLPPCNAIAGAIVDYAANNNVDLIVMGTKGKTGLKRFLIESVVRHPSP
jgi:hypothetical protein